MRLVVYANLLADQDTRVSSAQGMVDEMRQLGARFGASWAFFEPELLTLDPATINNWAKSTPALQPYAFYLQDVLRRKPHTLTSREEELMAHAGPVAGTAANVSNIFLNADLPWPTIKLADGKSVRLDVPGIPLRAASANRDDRKRAMEAFFGALASYRRTLGTTQSGAVDAALFDTRARKYDSNLANALFGPNIPPPVYHALVAGVNRHLPSFHRYLKLRQRMLQLPELHYYDLYAPLVSGVPLEYTVEEAQREVKAATALLGEDYVQVLDRAFKERWIDYYPTPGKQSGAYMSGGRVRRPPLPPAQLQRQVRRHVDARARARSRDAQLVLEQEAALCDRQLPDLRRRSRINLQRGAAQRGPAGKDQGSEDAPGDPWQLSGERQGHRFPANAVR